MTAMMMATNEKKMITNWRMWVISAILLCSVVLLGSDADDITSFVLIKLIGFALVFVVYQLNKLWQNHLPLIDEEE